mmetsp:Transcript_17740/g.66997  ORF Transcript_17740/g.66997 Transcript_17740/m.66997 type:complete len:423 (-) Transcript_17740:2342-3610(-)
MAEGLVAERLGLDPLVLRVLDGLLHRVRLPAGQLLVEGQVVAQAPHARQSPEPRPLGHAHAEPAADAHEQVADNEEDEEPGVRDERPPKAQVDADAHQDEEEGVGHAGVEEVELRREGQEVGGLQRARDGGVKVSREELPALLAHAEAVGEVLQHVVEAPAVQQLQRVHQEQVHEDGEEHDDDGEDGVEDEVLRPDAVQLRQLGHALPGGVAQQEVELHDGRHQEAGEPVGVGEVGVDHGLRALRLAGHVLERCAPLVVLRSSLGLGAERAAAAAAALAPDAPLGRGRDAALEQRVQQHALHDVEGQLHQVGHDEVGKVRGAEGDEQLDDGREHHDGGDDKVLTHDADQHHLEEDVAHLEGHDGLVLVLREEVRVGELDHRLHQHHHGKGQQHEQRPLPDVRRPQRLGVGLGLLAVLGLPAR